MAEAKTARGRFMGALGAGDGPFIFLPSITLVPPGFSTGRDVSGAGNTQETGVFTAFFPASDLRGEVEKYVYSALARGDADALNGSFVLYVICRDIGSTDEKRKFTVRYESVTLVPKGKKRMELRPGTRGVAGYVPADAPGDGGAVDEGFEADA